MEEHQGENGGNGGGSEGRSEDHDSSLPTARNSGARLEDTARFQEIMARIQASPISDSSYLEERRAEKGRLERRNMTIGDGNERHGFHDALELLSDPNTHFARAFDCYSVALFDLLKRDDLPSERRNDIIFVHGAACYRTYNTA